MDPLYLSNNGNGVTLVCSETTGATLIQVPGDGDSLAIANVGGNIGYIAMGKSGFSASAPGASGSTCSYPILVGGKEDQIVIDKQSAYYGVGNLWVAGVCKAGESTTLTVHLVKR